VASEKPVVDVKEHITCRTETHISLPSHGGEGDLLCFRLGLAIDVGSGHQAVGKVINRGEESSAGEWPWPDSPDGVIHLVAFVLCSFQFLLSLGDEI